MKDYQWIILMIMMLSVASILYACFAGVWRFNPTDIEWFNAKLLVSSIITFGVMSVILSADNDDYGLR